MAQVINNTKRFPDESILGMRIRYISLLNPNGVNKLAYNHGYHPPKDNIESRIGFINKFIQEDGEEAMTELLSIHPDKDLILDNVIDEVKSDNRSYSNWVDTVVSVSGKKYTNFSEVEEPIKPPITVIEQASTMPSQQPTAPVVIRKKVQQEIVKKDIPYLLDLLFSLEYDGVNFGNTSTNYGKFTKKIHSKELKL